MGTLKSTSRKTTPLLELIASAVPARASPPFVTASVEEIRLARRLRERIEERYLNRPTPSVSLWSVGADWPGDRSLAGLPIVVQKRLRAAVLAQPLLAEYRIGLV